LSIAYFGTGDFAVNPLKSLLDLKNSNPNLISNLVLFTKSDKPIGRNRHKTNIKSVNNAQILALENNLPIHYVDAKNDFDHVLNYTSFNMAIACSFGLLIPSDFIRSLKFGGLNIHPSLLPKHSGSSPLQYTLLNNDSVTGVTVQTLHPTKFDHGQIVYQSDEYPQIYNSITDLSDFLSKSGSDLLIHVLKNHLYLSSDRYIKPLKSYKKNFTKKV
ncbi:methionyl-tRNA formyltransferase, partial [Ascoidea rubescens DSM 1968]